MISNNTKKKYVAILIILILLCAGIVAAVTARNNSTGNEPTESGGDVTESITTDNTVAESQTPEETSGGTAGVMTESTATGSVPDETTTAITEPSTDTTNTAPTAPAGTVVKHTSADIAVMPDRYNTGAKGQLTESGLAQKIGKIQFAAGNNGTTNALDFYYRNKDVAGEVTIENIDFSAYNTNLFNDAKVDRNIRIVFNNCKFKTFACSRTGASPISFVFNNCSFVSFSGSNAVFNNCSFAGSYSDGMNPFVNVQVNNCYIYDRSSADTAGAGAHTDGTQIYGYAGYDACNISYKNCRFEMPAINMGANTAGINAPLMLQTEYSNGRNITFSDCTINGGGYSIYAHGVKGTTIDNILFKNISVGGTMRFGVIYPDLDKKVVLDNLHGTQDLYVGSVWKDAKGTHVSVTNDTLMDKVVAIYTDKGIFSQTIPACPSVDTATSFWEYPFDVDIVIPHDCKYVVCYDVTSGNSIKQIRFVNWSGSDVLITEATRQKLASYSLYSADKILLEGTCGKAATFSLTPDGVLTISGTGDCYNYHSGSLPPWQDYKAYINKIVIKEGITSVGNQSFKGCKNLSEVIFPNGFSTIGGRAFEGCSFITSITLPASMTTIGTHAFNNVLLQRTIFLGTQAQWKAIAIGDSNDRLVEGYGK